MTSENMHIICRNWPRKDCHLGRQSSFQCHQIVRSLMLLLLLLLLRQLLLRQLLHQAQTLCSEWRPVLRMRRRRHLYHLLQRLL